MSNSIDTNLKLWKAVEKTPPDMTKLVSYGGRRYTAIDPQWQLQAATAMWGPYGQRWGLRALDLKFVETQSGDGLISNAVLKAEFFYPGENGEVSFEILNDESWRAGDDTLKKLVTNTRSKALSWLGFSADVFLGKFDDTAYVSALKVKFGDQDAFVTKVASAIKTAKTLSELAKCAARLDEIIRDETLEDITALQELKTLIVERKQALSAASTEVPNVPPTLEEWLEEWADAVESGQSKITRQEAERRYYMDWKR